jgi:hypothetical protein
VLEALAKKVDRLIVGGGILNTFLLARLPVGKSLAERTAWWRAKKIMARPTCRCPKMSWSRRKFARGAAADESGGEVEGDEMILDIGPRSAASWPACSEQAGPSSGTARSAFSRSTSSRRAPNHRARDRGFEGVFDCRRRRHHRRDPQVRRRRRHRLHFHRGRRLPRVSRGQDAARSGGAGGKGLG